MKKLTIVRQALFTALIVAGMQLYSSCNSCSNRPEGQSEGTRDGMDANGDTRGSEEPADNENSGSTEGTGTDSGNASDGNRQAVNTGKKSSVAPARGTATGAGGASANTNQMSQEEIDNMVENSDYKSATNKSGQPVRSSGDAGSGIGTGTGSTGNNSRVTTREAQQSN